MERPFIIFVFILLMVMSLANALSDQNILITTHSTGAGVYGAGVASWFADYNSAQGTHLSIGHFYYPNTPYSWSNYPYDYWNLWVDGNCNSDVPNIQCLDDFVANYDVISWKHCYPSSSILADTGNPDVSSSTKTLENYKAQYRLILDEMDKYPDTLFIVWTLPPLNIVTGYPDRAARATEFSTWMQEEWLFEDGQSHPNVYVWDFRSIVAESNPDSPYYNYLKEEYSAGSDSHPNSDANNLAAPLLSQFIVDSMIEFFDQDQPPQPETGCNNPNLETGGKPCVEITSCGVLDQANTYYLLMNNVTSDDSCFLIAEDGIDLDLNGHSITYGQNPSDILNCRTYNGLQNGSFCHFGIVGRSDPRFVAQDFPEYADWTRAEHIIIKDGAIIQSPNSGRFSDNVRAASSDWTLTNLTVEINVIDTKGLVGGSNWNIQDSNIIAGDIAECVENRHQGTPSIDIGSDARVENNNIINVPHVGLRVGDNSLVTNNYISQNQHGDNAYGMWLGNNCEVSYNVINTTNGRGIGIDTATNITLHHNHVETYENKVLNFPECTDYPLSGTYSLRLRYGSNHHHIYENTFISHAYGGDGGRGVTAVLTLDSNDLNNLIENNTFIATSDGSVESNALVVEYSDENTFHNTLLRNNHFIADDILINFYGNNGRGSNLISFNDTFEQGPAQLADFTLFSFNPRDWQEPYNHNINGNYFTNIHLVNAGLDDLWYSHRCQEYDCEFSFNWTTSIRIVDEGMPVSGEVLHITNAQGEEIAWGTTNAQGELSFDLSEFTENNGQQIFYNPYTLEILSQERRFSVTEPSEITFDLSVEQIFGDLDFDEDVDIDDFLIAESFQERLLVARNWFLS